MAQEVDEALRIIAMCGSFIVTLSRGSVFLISQMINLRKLLLYSKWEGKENYTRMMKQLKQNGDTAKILDINTQDKKIRDQITKILADNHCLVADLPDLNVDDGHLQIQVAASQMSSVNLVLMGLQERFKDENDELYGIKVVPIDEMRYMQTGQTLDGKARPEVRQLFTSIPDEDLKNLKVIADDDVFGHVLTYRTTGEKAATITPQDLRDISEEMKALGDTKSTSEIIVNMTPINDEPVRSRDKAIKGKFFEISATENGSAGKVVFIPDDMLLKYQKALAFGNHSNFIRLDLNDNSLKDKKIRIYDAEVFEQLRHGDLTPEKLGLLTGTRENEHSFKYATQRELGEILEAAGVIDNGQIYSVEEERKKNITTALEKEVKNQTIKNEFTIVPRAGYDMKENPGTLKAEQAMNRAMHLSKGTALEVKDSGGRTAAVFINGVAYRPDDTEYIKLALERLKPIREKAQTKAR